MKNLQIELDKIRAEIEALVNTRDEIEEAPIPRSECAAQIAAVFDALPNDQLLDPSPAGLSTGTFNQSELQMMLSRPALLVAAFSDQLTEYLLKTYDRQIADAKPGLGSLQRRKKLAEIAAEIFKLETTEEAICEQLEDAGGDVMRRGDANPIAQLGLDAA